ncbi:carboxylic ester hydrolase-like [Sabethes cyaneus]|uniref:carboxylic ester hydrolase-like n=1 Tax=Sabethes cyaneus TaxID=53552 RepID=UPI00237E546A|nr:carboxylic ester hydrolase-like [Sabethes cyaneus]
MLTKLALWLVLLTFPVSKTHKCVVKYESGVGVGVLKETFTKRLYCAYLGIPYAQPPIGELRFEDPVAFHFNGSAVFDKLSSICTQMPEDDTIGDEDCLYLNVYTPRVRTSTRPRPLMPVLVWIHGGSFVEGSSETDIFGSEPILDKDIIVVTFNYRLASLGFMGIVDLEIKPNLGLKDQTEALRWSKRNIRSFGGDANRITLVGWSAGAAAATYHMYTDASKGLFQRVIAMSGVMTQPWAYNFNTQWCSNEYLKQIDATTIEELKSRTAKSMIPFNGPSFYYSAINYLCYMPSEDLIYVPQNPYDMVRLMPPVSDVPFMIGMTNVEHRNLLSRRGFYMTQSNYPNGNDTIYERIKDFLEYTRSNRSIGVFYRKLTAVADFTFGIQYFINHAVTLFKSPIYRYQFSFDGPFGYPKNVLYENQIRHPIDGAMHGDDLGYLFTPYNYKEILNESRSCNGSNRLAAKALNVQRRMVRLFTNFVKSSNPTPNNGRINRTIWPPYNDRNPQLAGQYLNIGQKLQMRPDRTNENYYYRLWWTIFECLYYYRCDFLESPELRKANNE